MGKWIAVLVAVLLALSGGAEAHKNTKGAGRHAGGGVPVGCPATLVSDLTGDTLVSESTGDTLVTDCPAGGNPPIVTATTFSISSPASGSQPVGTPNQTGGTVTTWSIDSCAGCTGWFTINGATGAITVTPVGASNITGATNLQTLSPVVRGHNASAPDSLATMTVNAYADGSVDPCAPTPPPAAPVVTASTFTMTDPVANGDTAGNVIATNSPTNYTVLSCAGCTGFFSFPVATSSLLKVTSTGATALNAITVQTTYHPVVQASNATGPGSATLNVVVNPASPVADGHLGASVCSGGPNDPNYFTSRGYIHPPWQVAGVDYCVGAPTVPPSGAYKDPSLLIGTPGITTCCGNQLFVHGSNITIDGYDFTGWYLEFPSGEGQGNITITNNKFKPVGSGDIFLEQAALSGTNVISHNTFDFANLPANKERTEINVCCGGSLDYSYNVLLNSPSDWINYGGGSSTTHTGVDGSITFRYNYMNQAGLAPADQAHADWMAATSYDLAQITFAYNLFTNPVAGGGTQGIGVPCDEGGDNGQTHTTVLNTIISNNTIGPGFGQGYYFQVTNTMQMTITNNYVDTTGHPGNRLNWIEFQAPLVATHCNGTQTKSGNINMLTGGSINP
jgi:hypothetical protein